MKSSPVISGSEAAKVLKFVEAALDAISLAVERLIVPNLPASAAARRDHSIHAGRLERCADRVAVIGLVGDHGVTLDALQHGLGGTALVDLAAGQNETQRPSEGIGKQVDLRCQSASGTPQSLVSAPLLAPPLPVAACWWALTRVASKWES